MNSKQPKDAKSEAPPAVNHAPLGIPKRMNLRLTPAVDELLRRKLRMRGDLVGWVDWSIHHSKLLEIPLLEVPKRGRPRKRDLSEDWAAPDGPREFCTSIQLHDVTLEKLDFAAKARKVSRSTLICAALWQMLYVEGREMRRYRLGTVRP